MERELVLESVRGRYLLLFNLEERSTEETQAVFLNESYFSIESNIFCRRSKYVQNNIFPCQNI